MYVRSIVTTVHDHIRTPLEWVLQRRRCKSCVDNQMTTNSMDLISIVLYVSTK